MAPVWPVKMIILIGCAAGAIQFLIMSFENFRKLFALRPSFPKDGS